MHLNSDQLQIVHSSLKPSDLTIAAMDTLVFKTNDTGDVIYPPNLRPPVLKLIVIPTTLSAAEYNTASGATHPATHKKAGFAHPLCAPKCIILDPGLCTTTPQRLWLSTGMRAVDHCVEALCTDLCTRQVAQSADEGLRCLVSGLLACRADATTTDDADAAGVAARSTCQFGAWKAMHAVHCQVPLGASHAIGHQLGSVAGVPHGETSCVMLPAVMKYNKGANSARQERVADILWSVAGQLFAGVGLARDKADAGDLIKALVRRLGLPTTLGEVGVSEEAVLDRIAEHTLTDMWGKTNPRRLDNKEQVREILRMAS